MDTYFLDTETTGLSPRTDRIVELAISDENGTEVCNTLVNPGVHIPASAVAIHGITNQMVREPEVPTLEQIWPRLRQILNGKRVVAYNIGYDRQFFPDQLACAGEVCCAMHRFTRYMHDHHNPDKLPYKVLNLEKATEFIGYSWSGEAHRAWADTLACKAVWEWLEDRDHNGINIFSGTPGLGGALSNMTELAREKKSIRKAYPVVFKGVRYVDAEAAYQGRKTGDTESDDQLMIAIIGAKLQQHPTLREHIRKRGGLRFIEHCTHETQARKPSGKSWEGTGTESRFLRCLWAAYRTEEVRAEQIDLFTMQD